MNLLRLRNVGMLAAVTLLLVGCRAPGKPGANFVPTRPDQVTDFDTLYQSNCQACHGVRGQDGTAVSLANPAYIAYAGAQHIAQITANGIGGSLMPAFAESSGGRLTDQQVEIIANGIVSHWGNPAALGGATPPPYDSTAQGSVATGETLYKADCLRCHTPGPSSILSPTYLALISDGGLRTILVAGKPHQGMPDWRGYPGGPLGDQQLADLVAFLTSHRIAAAGQPAPNAEGASTTPRNQASAASQQRLAADAGPATGGPKTSSDRIPKANSKPTVSPKP